MSVVKSIINIGIKYSDDVIGFGTRKLAKPKSIDGLKYIPQKLDDLSSKINIVRTPKEIVSDAIGGNCKITKDWQDLGTFSGLKTFFSRKNQHYIYSRPTGVNTFESGHISCYKNKDGLLEKFFVFDRNTKSIREFSANGKLITQFSPEETLAIFKYKHDSKNIHKILREGKSVKDEAQVRKSIKALSEIFEKGKAKKSQGTVIGYRALDAVSYKKILSMSEDGMIFTDPSFMSIATNKWSAAKFLNLKSRNHLMQITIPEGTKYLQMDDLGHIIHPQAPENEWVLNAGTNLLIKNRKGMIIAEVVKQ